jgi:hypothetical protein
MNRRRLIWLPLLLALTACGRVDRATPASSTAALLTPVSTVTASATDTPAATGRATAAATKTSTRPPAAPTRTVTVTASATASATRPAPSPTATQVPPAATVAVSPTPAAVISYFRAVPAEADPGDTINLEWATANAATVTLWRMAPTGQFGQWWDVEASGSFAYAIDPSERNRVTFALFAGDETSGYQSTTVEVILRCTAEWFFANAPDICPADAAVVSAGAVQIFAQAIMVWVQAEDMIYILFQDGNYPPWYSYTDEWDPGEPEIDPSLEPPPGFYQPVRGFGLLWREDANLRERLGWAMNPEFSYTVSVQRTSFPKYNDTYLSAPDGYIWRLKAERSGWEVITPNP